MPPGSLVLRTYTARDAARFLPLPGSSSPHMPHARVLLVLVLLAAVPAAERPARADGPAVPAPVEARPATPPGLDEGWPLAERARLAFLVHLGWRVEVDPALAHAAVLPGQPGFRADLAAAQAAGDLRVKIPPGPAGAAELRALLPTLEDSVGSRLAWQFRMAPAVRAAATKLTAAEKAGRFKFPPFLFWQSPWFQFHPPRPEWGEPKKEVYCAQGKPSAAIEAIYQRGALAECYTAQWVAAYAAQYELHGAASFDEAYKPEEIVVARPSGVRPTPIGQTMRGDVTYPYRALLIPPAQAGQDAAKHLGAHGPMAFTALTGIVRAQDESEDANQNLTTLSISPRACEILRTQGMAYVNALGKKLAEAHRGRRTRSGDARRCADEYEQLLADPVLAEWTIYVQPFGIIPVAQMFKRETEMNAKPIYVLLYVHGREDEFFRRYRATWQQRWIRAQPGGAAPLPAPAGAVPAR